MGCSIECLKLCVYIYSAIQMIWAAINIIYDIYMLVQYLTDIVTKAFMICFHALTVVIAILGCCGAVKENRCKVKTFAIFQVIFLIIYIILTLVGLLLGPVVMGILCLLGTLFTIWGVSAGFSLDGAISENEQRGYIYDRNNEVIRVPTPQRNNEVIRAPYPQQNQ